MRDKEVVRAIRSRFEASAPVMDERVRRRWAAAEARAVGRGGVAAVAEATGLDALVEPTARGDPASPLRWTCTSTRRLSESEAA